MMDIEQVRRAASEFSKRVFSYPNVIGCGVGWKTTAGRKTNQLCLAVFVRRKCPAASLSADQLLPRAVETQFGTLHIDVVERSVPDLLGLPDTTRYRPLLGGCEIYAPAGGVGWPTGGVGTAGAVMYDRRDARPVLLTCNHVVTPVWDRSTVPGPTQWMVFQPLSDAPKGIRVGNTKRIVPWLPAPLGADVAFYARVDAAIVDIHNEPAKFEAIDLGKQPFVPLPPQLDLKVNKRGRSTGKTMGTINYLDVYFFADAGGGRACKIGGYGAAFSIAWSDNEVFAAAGDSGSLIVDDEGAGARGIVAAADAANRETYASSLVAIMDELELETPCTSALDATFMRALRRRLLLRSGLAEDELLADANPLKKFRLRYMKAAVAGTVGKKLEELFEALAPELAEGLEFDDDFAGLIDHAIGDLIVQPTVFDMLEHRPPKDFADRLGRAFDRLRQISPKATGYGWVVSAFRDCGGLKMRDLLTRRAPAPSHEGHRRRSKPKERP